MTTLRTAIDAMVNLAHPATNYGTTQKIGLNTDTGITRHGLVQFSRPFPLGSFITSATLRIYLAGAWTGQTITASRMTGSWAESKVTWNNQPAHTTTNQATVVATGGDGDHVDLDITAMMQDVSGGAVWWGVKLFNSGTLLRLIYAAEAPNANYHPELIIEWSESPTAPTNLHPADGKIIGVEFPIVSWQFNDKVGAVQAAAQVQVDTGDFTTPDWDSGMISLDTPALDLSTTDFPGFANLDVKSWRVKVWDDGGFDSPWSDPVSIERIDKGVLTITNPPDDPDNIVFERTPPLDWTYTGATQARFQLTVYEVPIVGPTIQKATSGLTTATYMEWTLPSGILQESTTYRMVLKVWDDQDREDSPGDPSYQLATKDFTYEAAGGVAPIDTLVAQDSEARVILTWTRAGDFPDHFAIKVNGSYVMDEIDPNTVLVEDTTFSIDYWRAVPRLSHTFEVVAVVDDAGVLKHSTDNPTADATTRPTGIWLADENDSLAIYVAGQDTITAPIAESSTVYYPVARQDPVLITDGVRGYEGAVTGLFVETLNTTARAWRDNLLALRARRNPALRLIFGDLNLPVSVYNILPIPTPIPGDQVYDTGFSFFQTMNREGLSEFPVVLQ